MIEANALPLSKRVFCIARRREAPLKARLQRRNSTRRRVELSCVAIEWVLMRYRFPYVGANLRKPVLQPGISEHCETTDTGWCITRYASLLPQLLLSTHSSLTTEGKLRLSRPECLILRRGGLPVQRRSPTQALTETSIE